jgi:hypothetical protein
LSVLLGVILGLNDAKRPCRLGQSAGHCIAHCHSVHRE